MDLKANLMQLLQHEDCPLFMVFGELEHLVDYLISNGLTTQEWISVKDRLPEPGVRVLASDEEFVGEFYINKRGQWKRNNVNDVALHMALDILWWKPLPQPPKGE